MIGLFIHAENWAYDNLVPENTNYISVSENAKRKQSTKRNSSSADDNPQ